MVATPTDGAEFPVNLLSFSQPGVCRKDVIGGKRRKEKQRG